MNTIKHAWFSLRQSRLLGIILYKNASGVLLETTLITQTKENICQWDDVVYLGEVVEYVGRKTDGDLKSLKDTSPENIDRWEEAIDREKQLNVNPHRWN